MWYFVEKGQGRPLVLLHGIGMSHQAWQPVMDILAAHRRVIAFDVAGFGRSPILANGTAPTTINLAIQLSKMLKDLAIDEPVDIAGNSMGGWIALEAARLGLARSVVAISPAGLWQTRPLHAKYVFFGLRRMAHLFPSLTKHSLKIGLLRELMMAVPLSVGGRHIPAETALALTMDFVNAQGFEQTFAHSTRFTDGQDIQCPVTVAFGTHDWLLTKDCRQTQELPKHFRWLEPQGWGHVPMWKDPQGVAELILDGSI